MRSAASAGLNPLFQRFPQLAGRIPHVSLGRFPTTVEAPAELARAIGLAPGSLLVKRDDRSGDPYGGNKVRKLEFLFGAALARGARRVVTIGAVGSNHVLATGTYGRALGLPVDAVLVPQPPAAVVRTNLLCDAALGVRLRYVSAPVGVPRAVAAAAARAPRPIALIPPGGSSPVGVLGFVAGALELAEQVGAGLCPEPDVLYVPLGSGGTVAGLVLGLRLAGLKTRVVGVRVVDRLLASTALAALLARRTGRLLARRGVDGMPRVTARDFEVDHRFVGPGYGFSTQEGRRAIALAAEAGLTLDPTYTGKTFGALAARAREGGFARGATVLFWLTYNSRPLEPLLAAAPPADLLPRPLRRFAA